MKTLRETCLEYFRRRLSEGWECVSLKGHNAVLLSPDGTRREIDLRNDVETLRPNAGGDETNCKYYDGAYHDPDVLHNFEQVDDVVPDEELTRVQTNEAAYQRDLYNLPAPTGTGTINKITVYFRCYGQSLYAREAAAKASIKSDATVTDGVEKTFGALYTWETFTQEWDLNPADGAAWEWADISALQIGVSLKGQAIPGLYFCYCTQVYVEVDYTYVPPTPPVTPEYQKREIARYSSEAEATLRAIISRVTEFAADSGTASSGSQTTCVDTAKNWEADMWKGAVIEIYSVADDIYYLRTISGNDATTITFAGLPATKAVASGDSYAIRLTIGLVDLDKWGGTALTGRDVSLDLKALTDISITGILKSIGDIAAAESLIARIGAIADAVVDAGAEGSASAKLRRLTTDINALITRMGEVQDTPTANTVLDRLKDLLTGITLAELPDALTAAGNLKASIEEHLAAAVVLHAAGAETTSGNGADTDVSKYLYAETCIDVTAFADMASADLIVEGKDGTSGKYKTIHTHNFTATGTDWLSITMLAFQHVRARWVINTPGGSPSITFSVALQGKS